MSAKRTQTGVAFFSIHGDFITDHSRQLWQERKFAKAFDILGCLIGATREQHEDILMGRKKLIGVNDLDYVEDDWTPPDGYASFHQALEQGENYPELLQRREEDAWQLARTEWMSTRGSKSGREGLWRRVAKLVGEDKAKIIIDSVMIESVSRDPDDDCDEGPTTGRRLTGLEMAAGLAQSQLMMAGLSPEALPSINALLSRGDGIEVNLCDDMSSRCGWLLPDGKYYACGVNLCDDMSSRCGWLLPDGKYYACGVMEHIGLAESLLSGKHPGNYEAIAETLGWVKISRGAGGLYWLCKKKVTQRQRTKLFDYAEKHSIDFNKQMEKSGL